VSGAIRGRVAVSTAAIVLALDPWAYAFAADAPQSSLNASPVSLFSLVQVVLALALVLGAIVLFAWLMRRFVPGQAGAGGLLKVIGGVMVGPKERVVVVEVGDTWLLLGVAASGVTLVHSMAKPASAAAKDSVGVDSVGPVSASRNFSRLLGRALGSRTPEA
jgi:flagellar protein FliO/FliZ